MATLDLSKSGYGVEVLSYYLWGQATAPNKSEIANGKWLQRNKEITLNVSAKEYMKYVDKYTSVANFGIFQKFFDNKVPQSYWNSWNYNGKRSIYKRTNV